MKTLSFLRRPAGAPEPTSDEVSLHERVQKARDRLAHQDDPALLDALSERELAANRALAERTRDHERRERLARIEAAEKATERVRRTVDELADQQARDLIDAERAIAQQRHSSSPHTKVARLHRRRTLALRIVTSVLVIAMVVSAVSVQHNIAPTGGPTNIWWWMAYGIEFLISGTLIALMMSTGDSAEWDVIDHPWKARIIENLLLGVTVALNVFPYVSPLDLGQIGAHAIAPVIIGTALHTYSVVATRYSRSIEQATAKLSQTDHHDIQERLAALTRIGEVMHEPSAVQHDASGQFAAQSGAHAEPEQVHVHSALGAPVRIEAGESVHVHPDPGVDAHSETVEGAHQDSEQVHVQSAGEVDAHFAEPEASTEGSPTIAAVQVHMPSARTAGASAHDVRTIAAELVRRGSTTKPVEQVTQILSLAGEGVAPTSIARDIGIHHKTVGRILAAAEEIRHPRLAANGGRVIELDRRGLR